MKDINVKLKYGYFYFAFKNEFFFWDVIILVRRFLILFITLYFFKNVTNKELFPVCFMLGLLIISLFIHTKAMPYNKIFKIINSLEHYSLLVLASTVYIVLLYLSQIFFEKKVPKSIQIFLIIFFFITNFSFFCYSIGIIMNQKFENKNENFKVSQWEIIISKFQMSKKKDENEDIREAIKKRSELFFLNGKKKYGNEIKQDISTNEFYQIIRMKNKEISFLKDKITELEKKINGNKPKTLNTEKINEKTCLIQKKIMESEDENENDCNEIEINLSQNSTEQRIEELFCDINLAKNKNFSMFEINESNSSILKNSFKLFELSYIQASYSSEYKKFDNLQSSFVNIEIKFKSKFEIKDRVLEIIPSDYNQKRLYNF